jgi:hypothetical protein
MSRLAPLATCSRAFYDLALPHIFGVATLNLSAVPHLVAKPHLRGRVRRARFFCADSTRCGFNMPDFSTWPSPPELPPRSTPLLLEANEIRDLGLDDTHLEKLSRGSRVADGDLFVRLCERLIMLDMHCKTVEMVWLWKGIRQESLMGLSSLKLTIDNEGERLHMTQYGILERIFDLHLPVLYDLSVHWLWGAEPGIQTRTDLDGTSTVECLALMETRIQPAELAAILRIPQSLVEFQYQYSSDAYHERLDLPALGETLASVRETLNDLVLHDVNCHYTDRIHGLNELLCLSTLNAPLHFILDDDGNPWTERLIDVLPPSLDHLFLHLSRGQIDELDQLLEVVESHETFQVLSLSGYAKWRRKMTRLEDACESPMLSFVRTGKTHAPRPWAFGQTSSARAPARAPANRRTTTISIRTTMTTEMILERTQTR